MTPSPQRLLLLHLFGEYVPIFSTGFLGFRIRRLHKLYSLSGIYFHVSLVTNILFELCNDTLTVFETLRLTVRARDTVRAAHPFLCTSHEYTVNRN